MKLRFLAVLREETLSFKELSILKMAFKRLWIKGSRTGLVLAFIFSAVEAVLSTGIPIVLRYLVDVLNQGYNFGWDKPLPYHIAILPSSLNCDQASNWLLAIMVGLSVMCYGAFNIGTGFARNAAYLSQLTWGTELFAHIVKLGMDFHVRTRKADILKTTESSVKESQDFLYNSFFMSFLRAVFSIVFILCVIFTTSHRLFAWCLLVLAVGFYTNIIFGSRVSKEEKKAWRNVSDVQARCLDVMANIQETKLFGNEDYEISRRQEQAEQQLTPLSRVSLLWRYLTSIENFWQNLGFACAMFYVIKPMVKVHLLTVGGAARFITYYLMLFAYFMDMLFRYLNAQRLLPKLKEVHEVQSEKPSVESLPDAAPFPGLKQEIVFDSVDFTYYPKREKKVVNVLKGINLRIPKGKVTALVSESGGGKSTLTMLLMRLYDPTAGAILVDGVDIRNYDLYSYHRAFTVLTQQARLYNDRIEFNIGYSRIGSLHEKIVEAAKVARAHEFISLMPDGYDSVVKENSANLSGGQKQRIALARTLLAMYQDAEIVVLDEPTTGLDNRTSRLILEQAIQAARDEGKTAVVITHELRVMKMADQVVFISEGGVQQIGTHRELLEHCDGYRKVLDIETPEELALHIAAAQ